jgi:hypothetical protein
MVRKHIFDPDDLGLDDDDDEPRPPKRKAASMFDKEPDARPARGTGATRLDKTSPNGAAGAAGGGGAARDEVPSTPYDPDAT